VSDLDDHLPQIAAGDADAFARWMAGAEPSLRAGLRRFAAQVDAEAVLQEALLRVWQVAPRVIADGRPNALLRLAHRIAHNLAISEIRKRREVPRAEASEEVVTPRTPDPMLREVIAKCRELLPTKPSEALTARLSSAGGEPDDVLAERLGMKKNTFLQNFTRARALLAECLEKHGVDLEAELAQP
jgi:DNA-directed RNA polymerase specialized sigma24 family protein